MPRFNILTLWIPLKEGIGGESRGDRGLKHRVTLQTTSLFVKMLKFSPPQNTFFKEIFKN
jgi:hypothetical protein